MGCAMEKIKFLKSDTIALEMHKARIIQKIKLIPIDKRVEANNLAGNNSHLLKNDDVFLDMLTDSGTNAMTDKQLASMMEADDSYAGSSSFYKLEKKTIEIFDMPHFLPLHQGRACEHLLAKLFIGPNQVILTNYHFTTFKAHVKLAGGRLEELLIDEGLNPQSECSFKGNIDIQRLKETITSIGAMNIPFLRIEAGTNLIGGQPVSLENIQTVTQICIENGIKTVLDASLLSDNLFFMKTREKQCIDMNISEIIKKITSCFDIIYFSARKLTSSRGGGMCFKNEEDYLNFRDQTPIYEGFSTYGGMSIREIESMAIGLGDTLDEETISQGPIFIEEMTKELVQNSVPVVLPAGRFRCSY